MEKKKDNSFEGLENLNVIDFEIISTVSPNDLAVNLKIKEGIAVKSVVFPPNFNPNRSRDEAFDWLEKKVYSTKRANYIYKSKYSEDY